MRTLCVYTYPTQSYRLSFEQDNQQDLRVLDVKVAVANELNMSRSHVKLFGLYSGPSNNPIKLYGDNELLPEDISHFTFF